MVALAGSHAVSASTREGVKAPDTQEAWSARARPAQSPCCCQELEGQGARMDGVWTLWPCCCLSGGGGDWGSGVLPEHRGWNVARPDCWVAAVMVPCALPSLACVLLSRQCHRAKFFHQQPCSVALLGGWRCWGFQGLGLCVSGSDEGTHEALVGP